MTPVRPSALPDEIAAGYMGRILRHNGWSDEKDAMRALLVWSGSDGASRRDVSTVEILAKVAGEEVKQFVRDHTMLPLRRAILPYALDVPHGSTEKNSVLWTMALRHMRHGAYFCSRCVEEDLDFHGTPYWRREHQMPGLYWCTKHDNPLSHLETAKAFLSSPANFMKDHHLVDQHWTKDLKNNQAIQRFLSISSDLLTSHQPVDERTISRRAREMATELGLHTGRGQVRKPLLSDYFKSEYDKPWLDSVVPGIANQMKGSYWHPVDGAVSGKQAGVSVVVYALTFAVLYKSADDATNEMMNRSACDATPRSSRSPSDQVDNGLMRQTYIVKKGNHSEIAASVQVNRSAVIRQLERLGLPALGRIDPVKIRDVISLLLTGNMTLTEACNANEVPLVTMKIVLQGGLSPLIKAIDDMLPISKRKRRLDTSKRKPSPPRMLRPNADLSSTLIAIR